MIPRPPLVAVANPGINTDPWAGVWIAEDIETILAGVKSGSWIDVTLGAVSAGLDALAFVSDPIGSLLQYGVAWIIERAGSNDFGARERLYEEIATRALIRSLRSSSPSRRDRRGQSPASFPARPRGSRA